MTLKQKLLDALDGTLEDVSEACLLDILLDAYAAKKHEIEVLRGENARERDYLREQHDSLAREYRRMRTDPLYGVSGEYFFAGEGGHAFRVSFRPGSIELSETRGKVEYLVPQVQYDVWKKW